jgi:hypothetical protein
MNWNKNGEKPQKACAECLYRVGYSAKEAARFLCISHQLACNVVNATCGIEPERKGRKNKFHARRKSPDGLTWKEGSVRKKRWFKLRKSRIKDTPAFKLRTALRNAVIRGINSKLLDSKKLYGCHVNELRKILESKFKKGMTWENYGKVWQIDHHIPVSAFDLSLETHQRVCMHHWNLRPMWTKHNKQKGDRIPKGCHFAFAPMDDVGPNTFACVQIAQPQLIRQD